MKITKKIRQVTGPAIGLTLKQEDYQMINIFLLYIIFLTILSFGLIGALLIFFKDNSYILITGTLLVLSFAFYKLNKFHSLFYE